MCTLSFLPEAQGFHLMMNRDEQRSRPMGLAPGLYFCGTRQALYPSEPSGGTWIGINDGGLSLALINWYSRPQLQGRAAFSRGAIIPRLLTQETLEDAHQLLLTLPLQQLNPFRLIGVSLKDQRVLEWRSDSLTMECVSESWEPKHWFSSGFLEAEVSRVRGETVKRFELNQTTLPLERLRQLHRSHEPERGAYSLCMHRDDACTVSCTGLSVTLKSATMTYQVGSPCEVSRGEQSVLFFNPSE